MIKYIKIELHYLTHKEKYLVTYFSYLNDKIVLWLNDWTEKIIILNKEYSIYVNWKFKYSNIEKN